MSIVFYSLFYNKHTSSLVYTTSCEPKWSSCTYSMSINLFWIGGLYFLHLLRLYLAHLYWKNWLCLWGLWHSIILITTCCNSHKHDQRLWLMDIVQPELFYRFYLHIPVINSFPVYYRLSISNIFSCTATMYLILWFSFVNWW